MRVGGSTNAIGGHAAIVFPVIGTDGITEDILSEWRVAGVLEDTSCEAAGRACTTWCGMFSFPSLRPRRRRARSNVESINRKRKVPAYHV